MVDSLKYLALIITALAPLAYAWSVGSAAYFTFKGTPGELGQHHGRIIATIGGLLSTNFGVVLGLGVLNFADYRSAILLADVASLEPVTKVQAAAAWLYFIGILTAIILWAMKGFTDDKKIVAEPLIQLGQTGFGIATALFAVTLGLDAR